MIPAGVRSASFVAVVAAAAVIAGCSPVAAPAATPAPSGPAAVSPTAATPLATSSPPDATPLQPPEAQLTVGNGPAVTGSLGTYVFAGAGSDAPWLPGAAVAIGGGGDARVGLVPDVGTAAWRVRRADPGDTDGSTARTIASGSGPVAFRLEPAAGTIAVEVEYAGGLGSGLYYWQVTPG